MLLSYRKGGDSQYSVLALSAPRREDGRIERRKNYTLRRLYEWLGDEARDRFRETGPGGDDQ